MFKFFRDNVPKVDQGGTDQEAGAPETNSRRDFLKKAIGLGVSGLLLPACGRTDDARYFASEEYQEEQQEMFNEIDREKEAAAEKQVGTNSPNERSDAEFERLHELYNEAQEKIIEVYHKISDAEFAKLSPAKRREPLDIILRYFSEFGLNEDVYPIQSQMNKPGKNPLKATKSDSVEDIADQVIEILTVIGQLPLDSGISDKLSPKEQQKMVGRGLEAWFYEDYPEEWKHGKVPGYNHDSWYRPSTFGRRLSNLKAALMSLFSGDDGGIKLMDQENIKKNMKILEGNNAQDGTAKIQLKIPTNNAGFPIQPQLDLAIRDDGENSVWTPKN